MAKIERPTRFPFHCNSCQNASSYILAASNHARNQISGAEILSIIIHCNDVGFIRRSKTEMYMSGATIARSDNDLDFVRIFDGAPKKVTCPGLKAYK